MDVINTYHVGYPDIYGLGASFLAVLVEDDGAYIVYSGIVKLPDVMDNEYPIRRAEAARLVAIRGAKETYARAVTFYPTLPRERYDRRPLKSDDVPPQKAERTDEET